ncbi:50S ribosomal protein L15 [Patescibacteria group bacterium]
MSLLELKSKVKQKRKRVGRGNGSKLGTYCARGMNGQNSRSGGKRRPGFEGGQTPYLKRMPKLKGFKNPNRINYQAVNLEALNIFDDKETVDAESLYKKNLISKKNQPVKLLGQGKLEKALTIKVDKASVSATKAVAAAKGKLELSNVETTEEEKKPKKEAEIAE